MALTTGRAKGAKAATAARMRKAEEKVAAKLAARGWQVINPYTGQAQTPAASDDAKHL